MTYKRTLLQTDQQVIDFCNTLDRYPALGLDTESSGPLRIGAKGKKSMVNMQRATLTGLSFATPDQKACYAPVGHRQHNISVRAWVRLTEALKGYRGTIVVHNLKQELKAVTQGPTPYSLYDQLEVHNNAACTQVLAWLLGHQSSDEKHPFGLKYLSPTYLGRQMVTFDDTTKGMDFDQLKPADGLDYACEDAENALDLYQLWTLELASLPKLHETFWNVEMPFVRLLYDMEEAGMGLDFDELESAIRDYEAIIRDVQEDWSFLMPDVSMTSPKQLQQLYKRGLWFTDGVPRTDGGDAWKVDGDSVELQLTLCEPDSLGHQLAQLKLKRAAVQNMCNTFGHGLLERASQMPDLRLHGGFYHTGTDTGRLSCKDPNLMQIPVRTAEGKRIRQAFIPSPGYKLVSADYSQIELRKLCDFIGKGKLVEGYKTGQDVHRQTASELYGIPFADVTDWLRGIGKTYNFAVIYGAGPKRLAKTTKSSLDEAKMRLARYKEIRPEVFTTMQRLIARGESRGYAETMLGRRRYVDIQGAREALHQFKRQGKTWDNSREYREAWLHCGELERILGNTPIQGSAADIMKLGMLSFWREVDRSQCKLVCQVHDDLVTEMAEGYVQEGAPILQHCLENAAKLCVPLEAKPVVGNRWSELK